MPKSRQVRSFERMEQAGRTAGEGYSAVLMGLTRQESPASRITAAARSATSILNSSRAVAFRRQTWWNS